MAKGETIKKGTVFNQLRVLKELPRWENNGQLYRNFLCECVCGTKVEALLTRLKSGSRKSCGCTRNSTKAITHGLSKNPLYDVWRNMIDRCYNESNESYHMYGGRGIRVCRAWTIEKGYAGLYAFIAWAGSLPKEQRFRKGLQLDRRDNDKGYSPENCRWVTPAVNQMNKSTTLKCVVGGKQVNFRDFYNMQPRGVTYCTARARLNKGYTPEDAVAKLRKSPGEVLGI